MKTSSMTIRDTKPNRSGAERIGLNNIARIIVASFLLLAATTAVAGINFLPMGGRYTNPGQALVNVQHLGDDIVRIHTTGLNGELTLNGGDLPPVYEVPASATKKLPVIQEFDLVINLSVGVVEGSASGQILVDSENAFIIEGHNDWSGRIMRIHADVGGNASCVPLNGLDCGQLVVDLEVQGVLSDPNDPSIVGKLRNDVLASLIFDGSDVGFWSAISANATIGGNVGLINSLLEKMEKGESLQASPWADGQ